MSVAFSDHDPIRPLSVKEYYLLYEQGCFDDQKVELLEGVIYPMSPQKPPHANAVNRIAKLLIVRGSHRAEVRIQTPLTVSSSSEPEPDLALVEPGPLSPDSGHPMTAALVIEIADSSRNRDLGKKLRLYALTGIGEYWVVDLARDVVHVHQRPAADTYELRRIAHRGEALTVDAFPDVTLTVDELLGATPT